ncbi:MAG: hypothetical protein WBD22_04445 [Pyrinomonadaceae bacterium]
MKIPSTNLKTLLAGSVATFVLMAAMSTFASAAFTIIPPDDALALTGKTYGEWSVAWWQYAVAIPQENSPFFDETGANCNYAQGGPVFYLSSNLGGVGARNECVVPAGKILFIPLLAVLLTRDRDNGHTEHSLRNYCNSFIRSTKDLQVTIDGEQVALSLDPHSTPLRTRSPNGFFSVTDNLFGGGVTSEAVTDGYYLMIEPLPAGPHTITFGGATRNFSSYITYNLVVAP